MTRTTVTAGTSVGMSCRRNWPSVRAGCLREARAALEAEALAEAEQAERKDGIIPGCLMTRRSELHRPGLPHHVQQSYNSPTSHFGHRSCRMVPSEYYSAKAVDGLYDLGVDPFVAPEKTRHGRVLEPAPRGRIPKGLSPRDRMRRKLRTKRGRERYALRMDTVEPVFGQIKQGRGLVVLCFPVCCSLARPGPQAPPAGLARDCNPRDIPTTDSVHLSAPHQDGGRRLVPPVSLPVSYSSDGLLEASLPLIETIRERCTELPTNGIQLSPAQT